jgi:hypothetical protein
MAASMCAMISSKLTLASLFGGAVGTAAISGPPQTMEIVAIPGFQKMSGNSLGSSKNSFPIWGRSPGSPLFFYVFFTFFTIFLLFCIFLYIKINYTKKYWYKTQVETKCACVSTCAALFRTGQRISRHPLEPRSGCGCCCPWQTNDGRHRGYTTEPGSADRLA